VRRREFLRNAAIGGIAITVSDRIAGAATDGWFDRPMRWAQLTLAENDPGTYDVNFWLDYFRRTHSDAACLSAGPERKERPGFFANDLQ